MSSHSCRAVAVLFNLQLGDKAVYPFPKGISPKVKAVEQLVFELTYYDVTIQRVSHYTMRDSAQPDQEMFTYIKPTNLPTNQSNQ